jgi:hypothetical protein
MRYQIFAQSYRENRSLSVIEPSWRSKKPRWAANRSTIFTGSVMTEARVISPDQSSPAAQGDYPFIVKNGKYWETGTG